MAGTRLADLLAGLTRLADVGFGLPVGTAVRSCVLATRLANDVGLPPDEARAGYYTALLHHVGCVGYAHETARLLGDETAANAAAGRTDSTSTWDLFATFLPVLTRGLAPPARLRLAATALARGSRWADRFTATACELGRDTARRLGLPANVQQSLFHVYDDWRGTKEIPVGARVARLAATAVFFESFDGRAAAVAALRRRAGGMLDPDLVAVFDRKAEERFGELTTPDLGELVLDVEPDPPAVVPEVRAVAEVFGDLADVKAPYLLGHSRGVARLASSGASRLGLPASARSDLELAGLLHDVGRVAVSSAVWDKPQRLTADDWERVRLHPYVSERILAGSTRLARLAPLVGRHHERLDGSGYHRGCPATELSEASRVLAAADAYQGMTEPRPHRPARRPEQAAPRLLDAARDGRLDTDAVHAVLDAAGHPSRVERGRLRDGLTDREVEVLGLVARGLSNADIARRLVISRRTAEHHVQHVYSKIGVSGRAAATLYAVEHHLLDLNG